MTIQNWTDEQLLQAEEELKLLIAEFDAKQNAAKINGNSAFGVLGNVAFFYFDIRQAEAITTTGKLVDNFLEKKLNEYLNTNLGTQDFDYVLACDTDSIYLNLGPMVTKFPKGLDKQVIADMLDKFASTVVQPLFDKWMKELSSILNVKKNTIFMKREAIADQAIFMDKKKRYALHLYDKEGVRFKEPKIEIKGIESVRSSTPASCRTKIEQAFKIIFTEGQDSVIAFIEKFREEFDSLPLIDIATPMGVSDLTKYAHTDVKNPLHVRASKIHNELVKKHKLTSKYQIIKDNDKIKYVYLKEPNPIGFHAIAFNGDELPPEFGLNSFIDYDQQFETGFLNPLKRILAAIGWNHEKTSSLEAFFT